MTNELNYKSDIVNFKIDRKDILAETKDSILINKNGIEYWLQKKFVRVQEFTLKAVIGLKPSWEYNLSTPNAKITGLKLIGLYKEQK